MPAISRWDLIQRLRG